MSFNAYNKISSAPYDYQNYSNLKSIYKKSSEKLIKGNGNKTVTINENDIFITPKMNNFISEMERAIIESDNPIPVNENKEIIASNYKGIWANKSESSNWSGPIPLEQYRVNDDPRPEIIKKKPADKLIYNQDINVRYLNPPKLPKPGDIIINVEPDRQLPPAPPIIIRQNRASIPEPEPIIFREAPPKIPAPIKTKVINISGKVIPPPARKVIVEKLPQIPPRPQSIILERWLPYETPKRNVIYNKPLETSIIPDPKNLIVDWQSPDVEIIQKVKNEGIFNTDPREYTRRYRSQIKTHLPKFTDEIPRPRGITLASEKQDILPELEGDIEALRLVDLDRVGLEEYKDYLNKKFGESNQMHIDNDSIV